MFCEICQNFMDITNNVSSTSNNKEEEEENIDSEDFTKSEIKENEAITSSDFETKISEASITDNSLLSDVFVNEILEGKESNINFKNFDINDLNKNQVFNKLSNNQKTLVINRILEKIPKSIKVNKSIDINKESYNYCKTCGYYEKIKNKTSIFTRGNEKKNYSYNLKFLQYKNDYTLPTTKKYNCINDSCKTHTDPKIKYAVFFRDRESSYNIKYICTVCDSYWNTFIEK